MLRGKFWLIPGRGVIDVTTSEHAIYARKQMLQLLDNDRSVNVRNMLSPIFETEIKTCRRRGVPENALQFLAIGGRSTDPRVFAITVWGGIRVRFIELKSPGLSVTKINEVSLTTIREASVFWADQKHLTEFDIVKVTELSTEARYQVPISRLRDPDITADQLINGAFRIPDMIDGD